MIPLYILFSAVFTISVIAEMVKEEEIDFGFFLTIGTVLCVVTYIVWGLFMNGGCYLDHSIKIEDEILYNSNYGKVDSVFYYVNDTLINALHSQKR